MPWYGRKSIALFVLASLMAGGAFSAETTRNPDIEVNLEVLDAVKPLKAKPNPAAELPLTPLQGYKPPPMFGIEKAAKTKETPRQVQSPAKAAPSKSTKPFGALQSVSPLAAVPAEEVIIETTFVKNPVCVEIPVPRPRPRIMNASPSFIVEARNNMKNISQAQIAMSEDNLEQALTQPTAQQILDNIESVVRVKPSSVPELQRISIIYQKHAIILDESMKKTLMTLLPVLKKEVESHVEIRSFASSRQLALARALEIRDFFAASQIEANRINIKGLEEKSGSQLVERVDIYIRFPANH